MFLDDDWQGTWQFMAADLIEQPDLAQTFIHDIESAFFVLLWMAICYVESTWDTSHRSSFVNIIFNPPVFGDSGGSTKAMFMRSDEQEIPKFPKNRPLAQLLTQLKLSLSYRHKQPPEPSRGHDTVADNAKRLTLESQGSTDTVETLEGETSMKEADFNRQRHDYDLNLGFLKDHKYIINLISGYIMEGGWPDTEPAEKQGFVLSRIEKHSLRSSSKRCREAAAESEGGDARKRTSLGL